MPIERNISRLSVLVDSETTASSASSDSRAVSRTAVLARIVAMPSRRLSCSARWVWLLVACTRACSSRTSSATAWNLVRTAGVTRRRSTAVSISRTERASAEITSSGALGRLRFAEAESRTVV